MGPILNYEIFLRGLLVMVGQRGNSIRNVVESIWLSSKNLDQLVDLERLDSIGMEMLG